MADDAPIALAEPDLPRRLPKKARRLLWWSIGTVVILGLAWTTLKDQSTNATTATAPHAFCKATAKYEKEIDLQEAVHHVDATRQIPLIQGIADTAPQRAKLGNDTLHVRADAELFLQKMQEVDAAPTKQARRKLQDDPSVKAAVDRVNRYYSQGCGVFARNGGI